MAKPIRTIPTLYGEAARQFERAAERVEANPGSTKISRQNVELVTKMLRDAKL